MPSILDKIVETKRREIAAAKLAVPEAELDEQLAGLLPTRDFTSVLGERRGVSPTWIDPEHVGLTPRRSPIGIIAEVKKASPSAGLIRMDFDPVAIARTYEAHGAAAISVLTDADFFQGRLAYLSAIKQAVACPVLRKDFILDRYQLVEARVAGADAALLIAECLPGERLAELQREATALGLHTLVELHDAEQLPRVLACGAKVIGINNRDLRSFTTRLEHSLELLPRIPSDRIVVSESGIRTHADLERLYTAGASAVLVGESLMRAPDIGAALDALRGIA